MPLVLCAHAIHCPGCPLIELPYAEQLELKRNTLRRALAVYPLVARAAVSDTVAADPVTDFRLRTKLVVRGSVLGLFARGTHEVVDIPECRVLRPRLHAVASALRRSLPLSPPLSSVDLREADAGVLVTVAVAEQTPAAERRTLAETIAKLEPNIVSVAVSTRDDDAPQLLGRGAEVFVGPGELRHQPDGEATWHYAAHGAFTQAHAGQLTRLHAAIEAEIVAGAASSAGDTERGAALLRGVSVLELYAGSGALSLRLASRGARVTLVESFGPAARMAERAASEQGLELRVLCADAAAALGELVRAAARFDAIIVDPPRRGLAVEVRRAIAALRPAQLVYVSCFPETFARDASHLTLLGARLEAATPFDMIPLSDAVETLGRFAPAEPPLPQVLAEGDAFIAVSKEPHEATATARAGESSLLERVRRLPGAGNAVALGELEEGASGVCLFARGPEHAPALERALAASHGDFTLLAHGVTHAGGKLPRMPRADTPVRYERREVIAGHSLLSAALREVDLGAVGRSLALLRHPILGDERYGDRRANLHFSHRHQLERPFLHRYALTLKLPSGTERIEAPLAPDLERTLASLRERHDPGRSR